ncbi:hypothetical protein [Erythrobacter sp. R86502]|uniref:hypothetical protein n=1 Tax=Erythrobacter sp. R86502 TaxID=3093846 RepID=UPI0036D2848E
MNAAAKALAVLAAATASMPVPILAQQRGSDTPHAAAALNAPAFLLPYVQRPDAIAQTNMRADARLKAAFR